MPLFTYRALDDQKAMVTGNLAAQDESEVAQALEKKGLSPLSIRQKDHIKSHKGTLPVVEKITFCRYASAMLSSGLSLSEGIEVLQEETKHPLMKQLLTDISYNLERGQQLSTVFMMYPNVFDQFFLTLVTVGEVSGTLGDVFAYLEKNLRAENSLSQKIKGAMMYPVVVSFVMVMVGFLMFFFVLPQIGKVFLNMKLPLPVMTRMMFVFSINLSKNMIPVLGSLFFGIVALVLFARSQKGKQVLFGIFSFVPIVGNLIQQIDLARFTRIFSTLLRSAVPITQALDIAMTAFTWSKFRVVAAPLRKAIADGKPIADSFKEQKVFPALLIQMLRAGEKTGSLDKTLEDLATFYEEKVEEEVKAVTQVIEPVLILLVGISVGVMILSVIAPIYSVVSSLQSGVK